MQFLLYLSTQTMDIYNLVSKKVRVVENPPICRQYDFFGFYDSKQKVLSICTSRIKSHGNIENYVSETLLHESVHVAQSCKTNFKYLTPFGINQSSMDLNYQRENDLKKVIAFNYPMAMGIDGVNRIEEIALELIKEIQKFKLKNY